MKTRASTHTDSILEYLKAPRSYWILQLIGWSGMIILELINYTFFLVGEFSLVYLQTFLVYALIGILVTHLARALFKYTDIFSLPSLKVWTVGVIATLLTSISSVILLLLPVIFLASEESRQGITPIYVFGLIMNNGRYFLIWMVIYFLYQIMEQRKQVTEEKYENQVRAQNFELELLKRQINPHFLFNALNSIKALVLIDSEKSRGAIIKLSELLRYTLNYEQLQLVTIADEIQEVKKYFALENLRYGKRIEVEYDIGETVRNEFIPTVLILTLAENAIKHGVSVNEGTTRIEVKADGNEHGYFVRVSNTGSLKAQNRNGIGLRHVQRRLEAHFPDKASFILKQEENKVTAQIEIIQDENKNRIDRRRAPGERRAAGIA